MADRRGFQKERPRDSELGIRGPITAPTWKGSAIRYTPSVSPIYLSTTYCGNANKLRTREQKHGHEKGTMDQREKRLDAALNSAFLLYFILQSNNTYPLIVSNHRRLIEQSCVIIITVD
jgi:hypothetical protein